ncbi:hypothetical protein HOF65_05015 [bacterium]|nr:hypothetical protein [bacterium]MBT3853317.1 hypothetical protein [bacterium]MBT4632974.1 hypothetical protein [bacterium]
MENIFDVHVNISEMIKANIHHHKYHLGSHIIESNINVTGKPFTKKYHTV